MMTLKQYYLVKLAEEAAEVAQIALKSAHFGLTECQPGNPQNNAQRIYAELNDLYAIVMALESAADGEFVYRTDCDAVATKLRKVAHYLEYSRSLGLVECENPCSGPDGG